ncbi:MAG: metallophosphoesterase, partial [Acutalibacteraceae bacterium]
ETTHLSFRSQKLPESFDGFQIVHVSDLHNKSFGNDNTDLLSKIKKENPDIIVITGDIVDSRHTDFDVSLRFASQCVKIAPTYYVSGNHEHRFDNAEEMFEEIRHTGVTVLENEKAEIRQGKDKITLYGLSAKQKDGFLGDYVSQITALRQENDGSAFSVLLAHYPQYLSDYAKAGFDLVFSGHAHGGQIRIPFTNQGLFAPDQGFLPEYTGGEYSANNTVMILSRGLGNSLFPLRLFDRPQLICVTLKGE